MTSSRTPKTVLDSATAMVALRNLVAAKVALAKAANDFKQLAPMPNRQSWPADVRKSINDFVLDLTAKAQREGGVDWIGVTEMAYVANIIDNAGRSKPLCAECRMPQRTTPSGLVCENGHGGAASIEE